ncbi:MAG: DNA polymerase III subunit alpha [Bryobacteraceae bacterium]|nr:DNA polymerase III subunit alpha [Bryobacteraceae bacterium]
MPEDKPFVHLHCHTDYSLLDGACESKRLMEAVERQGMPAVAMTDHGNMFGAVEFYNEARKRNIHPVIGCEVYVSQQDRHIKNDTNRYNHLVLLCENQEGYRNLIKLVSTGFLDGFYYKPRIDKDLLAQHSKGLIALSACLKGDINETLMNDKYDEARRLAYEYQDLFGRENFFLEIQDHGLNEDRHVMPQVYRLSSETGIPLVATNDTHYAEYADHRAQDILTCIQTGKLVNDEKRMKFSTEQFFLKTRDEMLQIFGELEDALDRTWHIAQRCQVKLEKVKEPFPRFDVPGGHSIDTYFEYVTRQGFEHRRGRLEALARKGHLRHDLAEYVERLETEIRLIQQMKFSGYFLIVWDFIRFSKASGIPVGPGRGSAAGSLVAYCLGITDVDPLHYGLLFERFLNPQRISMPDIDIDFCTNRRGEVIQYVTEKYGREQVAQIITFGTLGAKAALKDVGRALDLTFAEVDRITKLIPSQPLNIKLKDALAAEPAINEAAEKDPRVREMIDVALRLEGMARNASVHAAGVVISPEPLIDLVPLYKTNKDEIVTQYDMDGLDKLGLLKMDFLGLTTLTIITEALRLIELGHGVKLELDQLPLDDTHTYEKIFAQALTSGVFQFESGGMKDVLRRTRPERIEDLIALNALYRPGPIKGGVVDDFIDRKHGRKSVTFDIPDLKPMLEETYGIILYQEQVMQIAQKIAGYTLGQADLMRRAMGKKKVEIMAAEKAPFLEGAQKRGYDPKKAEKLFDLIAQFAEYGFNKSHSAAYGYLAYLTGYLKAHYPVEFMAALLTSETGNTDKVVKYINECRDLGIQVLPPDVNKSYLSFTPDSGSIRFGLGAVKNVGAGAVEAIVAARKENGPYKTLDDFFERVDLAAVNKRVVESLIKAGAMDGLHGTRSQLFAILEDCMESGQRAQKDRDSGQAGLFGDLLGGSDSAPAPQRHLPDLPEWTAAEKLRGEKETLGFFVTGHPLDEFRWKVEEITDYRSDNLAGVQKGEEIALCGIITGIQRRRNKEQKPWAFMQLEDWTGATEALVFASRFEQLQSQIVEDTAVLMRGKAMPEEDGAVKLNVHDIIALGNVRVDFPSLIGIRVRLGANGSAEQGIERAEALKTLIERKPGATQVMLRLEAPRDFQIQLGVETKVRPDREFKQEIERLCGPESIEVIAS